MLNEREEVVTWVKFWFAELASGSPDMYPERFDQSLRDFGLTVGDIGETDETVKAAKRSWRVSRGCAWFLNLQWGVVSFERFQEKMAELNLSPVDIGETDETIAAADPRRRC